MLVKKRDGSLEEFNPNKILDSIRQAAMAVELKDGEVQDKAKQVRDLTRKLIASGFDPDDAADMAESQFDGYIEDGEYTEYDAKEAEEVLEMVTDSLDELGEYVVESDLIQDFVEKALMMSDHFKTAKEYIVHSSNRERIREMNTPLMKSFENLTFGNSKNVEKKRENANIDGDSAMGTMLKYGSESAKKFNLMYLVPPDQSEAHSNGDIHIHDLDFMALTETCLVDNTKLVIQSDDGEIRTVEARDFDRFLEEIEVDEVKPIDGLRILSKGKFVKIKNCVRHSSDGKRIIEIKTERGELKVTSDHRIPVYRDGTKVEVHAIDIQIGDQMISDTLDSTGDMVDVTDISTVEYNGYVYDFETENHYFSANGFTVHNCCQIDLEKLFTGGFNTGHGFLREPGEIRSYAALACISVQSNQNDQHDVA